MVHNQLISYEVFNRNHNFLVLNVLFTSSLVLNSYFQTNKQVEVEEEDESSEEEEPESEEEVEEIIQMKVDQVRLKF